MATCAIRIERGDVHQPVLGNQFGRRLEIRADHQEEAFRFEYPSALPEGWNRLIEVEMFDAMGGEHGIEALSLECPQIIGRGQDIRVYRGIGVEPHLLPLQGIESRRLQAGSSRP